VNEERVIRIVFDDQEIRITVGVQIAEKLNCKRMPCNQCRCQGFPEKGVVFAPDAAALRLFGFAGTRIVHRCRLCTGAVLCPKNLWVAPLRTIDLHFLL
jgi:hypothetical protein